MGGGGLLDDGADALLGELIERVERTEARVIGGNGEPLIPRAVRIGEEKSSPGLTSWLPALRSRP